MICVLLEKSSKKAWPPPPPPGRGAPPGPANSALEIADMPMGYVNNNWVILTNSLLTVLKPQGANLAERTRRSPLKQRLKNLFNILKFRV